MINCKEFVARRKKKIKERVTASDKEYELIIFQVGNLEASSRYVKHKMSDCEEVGIKTKLFKLDENITQRDLEQTINKCAMTCSAHKNVQYGMFVQLPLPQHINKDRVLRLIPKEYDVDGLNKKSDFTPCTPKGIVMLFEDMGVDLCGKDVTILGRSDLVGKPLTSLLIDMDATVTLCHSKTKSNHFHMMLADIIVSAVGKPNTITSESLFNNSAIIVDVGINFDEDGKMCGDVDKSLYSDMSDITPVPSGVGLYTRVALLENIIKKREQNE